MRRGTVLFLAAAAGYLSLTHEMLWMRIVSYITGGDPRVFAHVLGFFLIGVAAGAYLAERTIKSASPNRIPALFLLSALAFYLSPSLVARLNTLSMSAGLAGVHLAVAFNAAILAMIFPLLCEKAAATNTAPAATTTSHVYLANIVGSTIGPLLTGFVLMQFLSTHHLIALASLASLTVAGIAALASSPPRFSLVFTPFLILIFAIHPLAYHHFLERLHFSIDYSPTDPYKRVLENRHGIIAVTADPSGISDMIYGGGVYDGNFDIDPVMDSNGIQRAYFIAALHPHPRRVLEVGLSSGSWSRVIADYQPVEQSVIIEINPGYLQILRDYAPQNTLLTDPKVRIEIDDARRWLLRHPDEKFDVIVQNTTWHWRSQITGLLSIEYLQLCKRHLNPGGILYYNTTGSEDVARTAAEVFRHVVRYRNFIAAADSPFTLSRRQIRDNLLKFHRNGAPTFAANHPEIPEILNRLSSHDLTDHAPVLRADKSLRIITDDNMATEFKRTPWRNPSRSWGAFFSPSKPPPSPPTPPAPSTSRPSSLPVTQISNKMDF